jgi:hypothetical protein
MNNFNNLQTTKLGTLAEDMLINEFIFNKGFQPFVPGYDGSHHVDSMALSPTGVTFYMDCKAKSRRKYYADTGIDLADYNKYKGFDKPTYILFADLVQGTVYGNWIQKLDPKVEGSIVYFQLDQMVHYRDMSEVEKATLREYENSKYYK